MKKRIQLKQMVSFCLVVLMVFAMPLTCLAGPTREDIENGNYQNVIVGENIHRGKGQEPIYYRFEAPEKGEYFLKVINQGEGSIHCYWFDQELERIGRETYIYGNNSRVLDERMYLKKDEVLYIEIKGNDAKLFITSLAPKKPVRTLSKTALSLRTGKQETLYFTGDKSKVTWVSRDPAIATVSQNGVVTGKKKGVTFIYSIVNHKLYKTKVSVY